MPDGTAVVPVINELRTRCEWDLIVLTQDYHPPGACNASTFYTSTPGRTESWRSDHISFASNNEGTHVFDKILIDGVGEQVSSKEEAPGVRCPRQRRHCLLCALPDYVARPLRARQPWGSVP